MIDHLPGVFGLFAAISVAVERVVELLKGFIPPLASSWTKHENFRRVMIQVISVVVGAIIASQIKGQLESTLHVSTVSWGVCLLVGLMASGGSGLWNHALDIVRAVKVNKELVAAEAMPTGPSKTDAQAAAASKA
jgi:drug/metabolite transporter (DMT)-like permease